MTRSATIHDGIRATVLRLLRGRTGYPAAEFHPCRFEAISALPVHARVGWFHPDCGAGQSG